MIGKNAPPHVRAARLLDDFSGRVVRYVMTTEGPVPIQKRGEAPFSVDANLLHTSFEGGELEDPWNSPGPDCYRNITPPEMCPDEPEDYDGDRDKDGCPD